MINYEKMKKYGWRINTNKVWKIRFILKLISTLNTIQSKWSIL
jgi:hypothetical protein